MMAFPAVVLVVAVLLSTATNSSSTSFSFPPPNITSHPQSVTRYRGETASFSVSASGLAPLSYQWFKGPASLQGATPATLTFTNVRSTNAGSYHVIVTDAAGSSATSAVATLTIIDPSPTQTNALTLTLLTATSIFSSGVNPLVTTILAGTRGNGILDRGLLRFDVSSIPPGAVIQSARVQLRVAKDPRFPASSNFSLHRMLRPWGDDATWTNATMGTPWSAPGGQAGVDYSVSSSATRLIGGVGLYDFGPSIQMAADVQGWLDNPGTNYGWMLKTDSEDVLKTARHFGSTNEAFPPRLFLQYIHPATAPLTNVIAEAGNLMFRFEAADGWFYRVECADNLGIEAWATITNFPAAPSRTITISVPITPPRRFYRTIAE